MTVSYSAQALRAIADGLYIERAAANLPATAAQNIFTISGGRILLQGLYGEVTTIIQNQACTIKITSTPAAGTAIDLGGTSASIAAWEVGGRFTLPSPPSSNAVVLLFAAYANLPNYQTIVPPGQISYTTSATNTGQIKWGIFYVPLDAAATVVAA